MNKSGSILRDLQNIQSELGYTTDDTYLFNYKNKEKDLEKLLYKLSKYEKKCKLKKKNKKKLQNNNTNKKVIDNEKVIHNEKIDSEENKNIQKGGLHWVNDIPEIVFIPVIGPLFLENNYIQLENNNNLIIDLLVYNANHIINLLELFCVINIIYSYYNNIDISSETLLVTFIVYICRIIVNLYKCKKKHINTNNEINKFIILIILGLPLFLFLYNDSYYTLKNNIFLCFTITIFILPYFRLVYNKLNNFNFRNAFYVNVIEKIICAILFYIIIINNFKINDILEYVGNNFNSTEFNTNLKKNNNLNNDTLKTNNNLNNDILLNNFKKIFAK